MVELLLTHMRLVAGLVTYPCEVDYGVGCNYIINPFDQLILTSYLVGLVARLIIYPCKLGRRVCYLPA